jgi:glycosyltransferase involved in cell wall biosynthesis
MEPRRLLFLSQTLPYPPDSGVNIRTYHTLKALAGEFSVSVLAFFRRAGAGSQLEASELAKSLENEVGAGVTAFPIPMEWSRFRTWSVYFKSTIFRRPFTYYAHQQKPFGDAVTNALRENSVSLVHLDSLDLSYFLPLIKSLAPNAKVACTHHNVESRLLHRRAERETDWTRRSFVRSQANLYRNEEATVCPRCDLNIAVSDKDAETLKEITGVPFEVIPNGVDVDYFRPSEKISNEPEIVFLGGTNWFPNRDALDFLVADILPKVREALPDVKVTWVGRCAEDEVEEFSTQHGVHLTGYVDDVRPYLSRATCLVVPLRVGGGTRLKITTAWAAGVPVVSTSVGMEGLMGTDGTHFLVRDEGSAIGDVLIELLKDRSLQARLAEAGRDMAERHYSWDVLGRRLREKYVSLVDR